MKQSWMEMEEPSIVSCTFFNDNSGSNTPWQLLHREYAWRDDVHDHSGHCLQEQGS